MGTTSITLSIKDLDKRLQRTKAEFIHLIQSPFAKVNYCMFQILGTLPVWIAKMATQFQGFTFVLSNFPGPPIPINIFGLHTTDISFWLPLMRNLTGESVMK
jgi:hypothetical protein